MVHKWSLGSWKGSRGGNETCRGEEGDSKSQRGSLQGQSTTFKAANTVPYSSLGHHKMLLPEHRLFWGQELWPRARGISVFKRSACRMVQCHLQPHSPEPFRCQNWGEAMSDNFCNFLKQMIWQSCPLHTMIVLLNSDWLKLCMKKRQPWIVGNEVFLPYQPLQRDDSLVLTFVLPSLVCTVRNENAVLPL